MPNDTQNWKCYHCGEVFIDPVLAAEHFGDDRNNPRPAACQGMLNAMAEAFERYGIHRNFHNAASVKLLANQRDAALAERDQLLEALVKLSGETSK